MQRKTLVFLIFSFFTWLQVWGQKVHKPWFTITPMDRAASSPAIYNKESRSHAYDTSFQIISRINIIGNKRTKNSIILRELGLHPGDTMYADDQDAFLEEKRQQLLNSSLFLTVNIYPVNASVHRTELNVEVLERQYFLIVPILSLADRNFNVWWVKHNHELNRLNYGVKLYENNLTGNKDRLGIGLNMGYTQRYTLSYDFPYFDKAYHQGAGIFASFSHNREVNYAIDSNKQIYVKQPHFLKQEFKLAVHYTYKKAIRLKHEVTLSYNSFKVNDTVLKLNPNFFPDADRSQKFLELKYDFSYIGTNIWAYPLHGYSIDANITHRGFGLLGKTNETELILHANKYWQFFPKTFGQIGFTGNMHFPDHQPYFVLNGMGYSGQFLRGMEYYVIQGNRFGILYNTLKRQIFAFRIHSRLLPKEFATVPIRMYFKIYGDLGYNHTNLTGQHSMLSNKLLYSYGLGVDIVTFYDAILRIEYSFNQLGEKGLFLHFKSTF